MYVSLGSSSSARLYSASARAYSPVASRATARLLCARALFGSFATACSKRKEASRQRPFLRDPGFPNAICEETWSVRWHRRTLHPVDAARTRTKVAASISDRSRYYRKASGGRFSFRRLRGRTFGTSESRTGSPFSCHDGPEASGDAVGSSGTIKRDGCGFPPILCACVLMVPFRRLTSVAVWPVLRERGGRGNALRLEPEELARLLDHTRGARRPAPASARTTGARAVGEQESSGPELEYS